MRFVIRATSAAIASTAQKSREFPALNGIDRTANALGQFPNPHEVSD
jgi:hypothetical protein